LGIGSSMGIGYLDIGHSFVIPNSGFEIRVLLFFLLPIPYLPIAWLLGYTVWLIARGVACGSWLADC